MDWLQIEVRLPSRKGLAWAEYWLNTHAHGAMVIDPYVMQEKSSSWEAHAFSEEDLRSEAVTLTSWIPAVEKERLAALKLAFARAEQEGVIDGHHIKSYISADWLKPQADIYQPRPAGEYVQVLPVGKEPLENRPIIATIEPGIGFGTGEHPTTLLALELLQKQMPLNGRVFDVGCGNGVLSIIAKKLGASTVFAFDHDPMAIKQARKNADLSDASIVFEVGHFLTATDLKAQLIVSNIVTHVLLALIPSLDEHLYDDGRVILSGIEAHRAEEVYNALWYHGFSIIDKLEDTDWVAIVAQKRPAVYTDALLAALKKEGLLKKNHKVKNTLIRDITYDSRQVKPNMLFICKGQGFKSLYAEKALLQGASLLLAENSINGIDAKKLVLVKDIRRAMAVVARIFFGQPDEKLNITAITATKGKSTTVTMLADILAAAQEQAAVISTACLRDGLVNKPAELTTPENVDLYRHLRRAQDMGLKQVILEVSSQALKYHRVYGMMFANAAFMNISPDHIGPIEHPDFADYFHSKCLIFKTAQRVFLPAEDEKTAEMLAACAHVPEVYTLALEKKAQITATELQEEKDGTHFIYTSPQHRYALTVGMAGRFNVENALYAAALAEALQLDQEAIVKGLKKSHLAGRMECIDAGDLTIWVDFAHNGLAFHKVFTAAKETYPQKTIWALFGAPGGKAQSRRKDLGKAAAAYADQVILTADDPAKEAVSDICQEIAAAMGTVPYQVIEDRKEAIFYAINHAPKGALLLLLGKGAEMAQKGPDGPEPWPGDKKVAESALFIREK